MDILLGRQGFGARSYFNTKNDFPIIMFQSIIIRPGRKEAKRLRPKRPSAWRSMPCGWQSLRQRINRHSIPRWCWWFLYRQPNQDVIGENCVRNAAGELNDKDKMKAWAEHCARVLNVEFEWPSNESSDVPTPNTHTTHTRTHERTNTHTHLHLLASSQCVCDTDPQSTQQGETQQGCWPFWHHSRDAETYWWGKSWAGRKTGGGCFQKWYDPSRREESFILNLYKGKGKALDHGNYHVSSS